MSELNKTYRINTDIGDNLKDDFITIGANTLTVNNALNNLCTSLRYNAYTLNGDNTNTTFDTNRYKVIITSIIKFYRNII